MKTKHLTFLVILGFITFLSCKKKDNNNSNDVNVYACGGILDTVRGDYRVAFWRNGVIDTPSYLYFLNGWKGQAVVSNGDFYVPYGNGYLKNGTLIHPSHATDISELFVSEGNIYAVGVSDVDSLNQSLFYWKNGEIILIASNLGSLNRYSITVVGEDIFIAGDLGTDFGYWKNKNFTKIHGGKDTNPFVGGIVVSNSDIFAWTGNEYWQNGDRRELVINGASFGDNINCIIPNGEDVYMSTSSGGWNQPLYWKNGKPMEAGKLDSATTSSMAVVGNDIYVAGTEISNTRDRNNAVIWKNGTKQILAANAFIGTIIVEKK
jgi:hypothetical protein